MRIVDVCAFYAPHGGGVKTYVRHKMLAGPAGGHEIVVLAPASEAGVERFGPRARIEYLPARRFPLDGRYHYFDDEAAVHARLDALRPDLVEASTPWGCASMVANWRGSAPRSLIMHADPLGNYAYRWFRGLASRAVIDRHFDWFWRHLRRLDARFDHIVCASDELAGRLRAGGLRHVTINRMGVQPGLFSPARRDPELRARLLATCDLGPDALLLLGAGRHAPEKRWPTIIAAATAAGFDRPVGLVIAGDGRARASVQRAAAGNPHVRLMAPVTDRAAFAGLLASADLLVHGSESETFCMIAAEARASGVPMLLPDGGAAADHLVPGAGALYAAADAESLAQAIRRIADEGMERHRAAAGAAAAGTRTMDAHFDDLFALYAESLRAVPIAA
jgi:alpha-1,6-mannosyltransferase